MAIRSRSYCITTHRFQVTFISCNNRFQPVMFRSSFSAAEVSRATGVTKGLVSRYLRLLVLNSAAINNHGSADVGKIQYWLLHLLP